MNALECLTQIVIIIEQEKIPESSLNKSLVNLAMILTEAKSKDEQKAALACLEVMTNRYTLLEASEGFNDIQFANLLSTLIKSSDEASSRLVLQIATNLVN